MDNRAKKLYEKFFFFNLFNKENLCLLDAQMAGVRVWCTAAVFGRFV